MNTFAEILQSVQEEITHALSPIEDEQLAHLRMTLLSARRLFIAGKGRTGLQMRGFAMRLMHLGLHVHVVDDVTTPGIGAGDLLVIGSGSGRTPSLIRYAERAKAEQAGVVLFTVAEESPVGAFADIVIRIAASTPKLQGGGGPVSLLPMASVFEQALGILLDISIYQLMLEIEIDEKAMFARHANLE